MAITHTQTVTELEVLKDNSDDIVGVVSVTTTSVHDLDLSLYRRVTNEEFKVETTGISASTSGFKPYNSLTESDVLGWISSQLASSKTKKRHETSINEDIARYNRSTVDKALPW